MTSVISILGPRRSDRPARPAARSRVSPTGDRRAAGSPRRAKARSRTTGILLTARAYALFTSDLPTGSAPDPDRIAAAVRGAVRIRGGARGCLASVAYAYGDQPEIAAARMAWALRTVATVRPARTRPARSRRTPRPPSSEGVDHVR